MLPKDPATQAKVLREVIRSYTYVLTWMGISIAVILFNKWLLAYSGFPFPIALTVWHMFFCSCVGFLAVRVFKLVKSHNMTPREYYTRVMPIGLLYAGSLWLSNSAYLYLSVSFIQMTKSLMPGLVYASGVMLGTEKYSRGVTLNMLLIAFGVVVCAIGELNLVFTGVVQQLTALGFEAMRLTMVQVLINSKGYNMNPIQSLYYVSPACLFCLLIPFLSVELGHMRASHTWTFHPSIMLANALTAFILNLAVFMLIGKTSALTMNIAGVIKDWMLIFFSFYLFKAPVTALNLGGYAFCCSGVVVYNHMKLQMIKSKVATSTPGGKDEEKPLLGKDGGERSKEDILSEIRRLQSQMAELEDRVNTSAKVMNGPLGTGTATDLGPAVVPAPSALFTPESEKESKDNGVVVYNHMKLQMIKSKVATSTPGGKDEEKPLLGKDGGERSKEDILSEIRRLQSQMAELEDRVNTSAKVMNGPLGTGTATDLGPAVVPAPSALFTPESEKESKDK